MEEKKVSIVVPVYNAEKYLPECLQSLLDQSYRNLEVVLVDDGSKDNSLALCRELAESDERVVVIHQENAGVSAARNRGIDAATGDYVAFCDSDDLLSERFIEEMIRNEEAGIFPIALLDKFNPNGSHRLDPIIEIFDNGKSRPTRAILAVYRGLYRKALLDSLSLRFSLGRKTGEDQEFIYKYLLFCQSAGYVENAVYHYRMIPTSAMHAVNYSHFDAVDAMLDTVKYAEEHGTPEQARQYREDLIYNNAVRTLEFAITTVLTGGERPQKVFNYLKEKGYHALVMDALRSSTHYDSRFYRLYRISPKFCLRMVALRKTFGRLLRKLKK